MESNGKRSRQLSPYTKMVRLLLLVFLSTAAAGCPELERAALLAFKDRSIVADPYTSLSSWHAGDPDCCRWAGVACSNRTNHVVALNLYSYSLVARSIGTPLLRLSRHLRYLDLSGNDFSGAAIPAFIGTFPRLLGLALSGSNFTGRIPPDIGNLTALAILYLDGNNGLYSSTLDWLTSPALQNLDLGSVDLSTVGHQWLRRINRLSSLQTLGLSGCSLPADPEMTTADSNLTALYSIDLRDNSFAEIRLDSFRWLWTMPPTLEVVLLDSNGFVGQIPAALGNMTSLQYLAVNDNMLVGALPATLESLCSLQFLNIRLNSLAGDIEAEVLGRLPRCARRTLLALVLSHNSFTGRLPSWMEELHSLFQLEIDDNQLTGVIPERMPQNLTYLKLEDNSLSGPLPDAIMTHIQVLLLAHNNISGTIPSSICTAQSLVVMRASDNQLTGLVPQCGMIIRNLTFLNLADNLLTGEFPLLLRSCPQLVLLDLSRNYFFGSLPAWMATGSMPNLQFLVLNSNSFSGAVPEQLSELQALQYLDISDNRLAGNLSKSLVSFKSMTVPSTQPYEYYFYSYSYTSQLFSWKSLFHWGRYLVGIDLSSNRFTGSIPEEIGMLIAIHSLNLSRNSLTGAIPESIGLLNALETLDLSYNKLSGEIPSSLSELTSLSHLNLSYNNLSGRVPSGRQLQVLADPKYIYIGNIYLCGAEIQKECPGDDSSHVHKDIAQTSSEEDDKMALVYGLVVGSIFGMWLVYCTLLFNTKWRLAIFTLVDKKFN